MAQRDKVKELVGRGLNSYHTKALQQMDRIEKKNKEQNHKISILSNELDNDYLTKTEEGSVISLEHSKEGMVYLDELQGNTLVNYCTDGSNELTLNGDIDIEGTFVTTTEGVDNGKIDVLCEGNTLVNLSVTKEKLNQTNPHYSDVYLCETERIKPNTTYTLSYDFECNINFPIERCYLGYGSGKSSMRVESGVKFNPIIGRNKLVFTISSSELERVKADGDIYFFVRVHIDSDKREKTFSTKNVMLLEGDWSNKEIPTHFEGMKSVGEIEGNKIEILSQSSYPNLIKKSKNLSGNGSGSDTSNQNGVQYLIEDNVEFARVSANKQDFSNFYWWLQTVEPRKKGETYTISYDYRCVSDWGGYWYPSESYSGSFFPSTNGEWRRMKITRTITSGDAKDDMLFGVHIIGTEIGDYIDIKNVKMEKGTNNSKWIPSVMDEEFLLAKYSNKKEILINEPLRGLPNGVKDRFVKIGGKWFIERNVGCKDLVVTGGTNWGTQVAEGMIGFHGILDMGTNYNGTAIFEVAENIVCDKLPSIRRNQLSETTYDAIIRGNSYVGITVKADKLETQDLDGFKKYINSLNAKFIYNLATPEYEPLEIESTLNTYNDVTHISNNSIIPCNMKIKNTGYNAIIKPNTLYTVALDTNKSGTVGMNLGGAKVTTTNNVATITTPATLSDDSLKLYGKGIKGSKVRLLEEDKTNWIPSHFEGMKSSFEDKVQEDGSYKMEILSNNKNLISFSDLKNVTPANGNTKTIYNNGTITIKNEKETTWSHGFIRLKVEPNTTYTIRTKCNVICGNSTVSIREDSDMMMPNVTSQQINGEYITTFNSGRNTIIRYKIYSSTDTSQIGEVKYYDFIMSKVNLNYLENKHNKIQFSSIEPLRGVGDTKDKFVFKDGKLMIERIYKQIILDGSENWTYKENNNNGYIYGCDIPDLKTYGINSINQGLTDKFGMRGHTNFCAFFGYFGGKNINIKLPYAIVSPNNESIKQWISENNIKVVYETEEPTYEEIPFELQKIILEGYENGTLFIDTNIPPTVTTTYAGETPIVKSVKLNKTEVLSNTEDINDNIIPYLMDMDYRVVMLQLATEELEGGVSMARLFGGTYEMIKRDILSKRLTREEYGYRLADYFNAGKLTEQEVRELEDLR